MLGNSALRRCHLHQRGTAARNGFFVQATANEAKKGDSTEDDKELFKPRRPPARAPPTFIVPEGYEPLSNTETENLWRTWDTANKALEVTPAPERDFQAEKDFWRTAARQVTDPLSLSSATETTSTTGPNQSAASFSAPQQPFSSHSQVSDVEEDLPSLWQSVASSLSSSSPEFSTSQEFEQGAPSSLQGYEEIVVQEENEDEEVVEPLALPLPKQVPEEFAASALDLFKSMASSVLKDVPLVAQSPDASAPVISFSAAAPPSAYESLIKEVEVPPEVERSMWSTWKTASEVYDNTDFEERDPGKEVDFWRSSAQSLPTSSTLSFNEGAQEEEEAQGVKEEVDFWRSAAQSLFSAPPQVPQEPSTGLTESSVPFTSEIDWSVPSTNKANWSSFPPSSSSEQQQVNWSTAPTANPNKWSTLSSPSAPTENIIKDQTTPWPTAASAEQINWASPSAPSTPPSNISQNTWPASASPPSSPSPSTNTVDQINWGTPNRSSTTSQPTSQTTSPKFTTTRVEPPPDQPPVDNMWLTAARNIAPTSTTPTPAAVVPSYPTSSPTPTAPPLSSEPITTIQAPSQRPLTPSPPPPPSSTSAFSTLNFTAPPAGPFVASSSYTRASPPPTQPALTDPPALPLSPPTPFTSPVPLPPPTQPMVPATPPPASSDVTEGFVIVEGYEPISNESTAQLWSSWSSAKEALESAPKEERDPAKEKAFWRSAAKGIIVGATKPSATPNTVQAGAHEEEEEEISPEEAATAWGAWSSAKKIADTDTAAVEERDAKKEKDFWLSAAKGLLTVPSTSSSSSSSVPEEARDPVPVPNADFTSFSSPSLSSKDKDDEDIDPVQAQSLWSSWSSAAANYDTVNSTNTEQKSDISMWANAAKGITGSNNGASQISNDQFTSSTTPSSSSSSWASAPTSSARSYEATLYEKYSQPVPGETDAQREARETLARLYKPVENIAGGRDPRKERDEWLSAARDLIPTPTPTPTSTPTAPTSTPPPSSFPPAPTPVRGQTEEVNRWKAIAAQTTNAGTGSSDFSLSTKSITPEADAWRNVARQTAAIPLPPTTPPITLSSREQWNLSAYDNEGEESSKWSSWTKSRLGYTPAQEMDSDEILYKAMAKETTGQTTRRTPMSDYEDEGVGYLDYSSSAKEVLSSPSVQQATNYVSPPPVGMPRSEFDHRAPRWIEPTLPEIKSKYAFAELTDLDFEPAKTLDQIKREKEMENEPFYRVLIGVSVFCSLIIIMLAVAVQLPK